MKKILGISAFYHDSAAALLVGGEILAAAQEERFTREKHTSDFPINAIKYCLEEGGLEIDELDNVVFYDKPLLKFERLLETYYAFSPKGLVSFLKAIPVWLDQKLFLKKLIYEGLTEVGNYNKKELKLLFPEHHLSHAASAFLPSPYKDAAILTIDGVGEWSTASISMGRGNTIEILKEMHFPHSVGLLYSAFTQYLGFKVNSGEYKLMGLAPYGNSQSIQTKKFISLIKEKLVDIKEDGSIWLNQSYFNYATGLSMIKKKKWKELFGIPIRNEEEEISQDYCNLALAIQKITEEIVFKMAQESAKVTGCTNLCLAGGVALNCVANGALNRSELFKNIYIQPAAGDAGGALGAAFAVHHLYYKEERKTDELNDSMNGAYLGPYYSKKEIEQVNKKVKAVAHHHDDFDELTCKVANELKNGKVIGWFQDRMEFGPRALGNRSILADPRNFEMQKKLNLKIKYRESFRPFAPAVLFEDVGDYFDFNDKSPYMLFVDQVKKERQKKLPENFNDMTFWEKLYVERSDIQSITHIDFSARIQTIHKDTNERFWQLTSKFKEKTGCSILINTSFNVRGEPIVCNPYDAYRCFMSTDMDVLIIEDFIYYKTEQPDYLNKDKWIKEFKKD